jgi:hypothetical protein
MMIAKKKTKILSHDLNFTYSNSDFLLINFESDKGFLTPSNLFTSIVGVGIASQQVERNIVIITIHMFQRQSSDPIRTLQSLHVI